MRIYLLLTTLFRKELPGLSGGCMPPSVIGQIAEEAHVKRLVLSHRMLRTLGKEGQSLAEISKSFSGPKHSPHIDHPHKTR